MQMLLRQTEPLTFSPNPVVSASSLKFGGASHSSSPASTSAPAIEASTALTIAIELACRADG